MAIQTLTTIKNWFKSTLKPTEVQYRDTWDSFYHKLEGIGISAITNLSNILNNKADVGQLDGKADKGHGHVVGDTEDLENILENKADKTHSHNMDDVDGLQDTFNDQYLYFNNAVNDEITQRKEADEALQDEIDSLKKITMIRGNVDTYADLLAMDTATIREGDSYIVEKDEARAGKSTLYIWTDAGWVYTGEWASGGSSENLGNTDLVQTDDNRVYKNKTNERLRFKTGTNEVTALEIATNGYGLEVVETTLKGDIITLDNNDVSNSGMENSIHLRSSAVYVDNIPDEPTVFPAPLKTVKVDSSGRFYRSTVLGGSDENLGNSDLVQTDAYRAYYIGKTSRLDFLLNDSSDLYLDGIFMGTDIMSRKTRITNRAQEVVLQTNVDGFIEMYSDRILIGAMGILDLELRGLLTEDSPFTVLVIDAQCKVSGRKLALHTLPDVQVQTPLHGDVLRWNQNLQSWVNSPVVFDLANGSEGSDLDQRVANLEQMQQDLFNQIQNLEQEKNAIFGTLSELFRRVEQLENR